MLKVYNESRILQLGICSVTINHKSKNGVYIPFSFRIWPSIIRHGRYRNTRYPNNKLQYNRHTKIRSAHQLKTDQMYYPAQERSRIMTHNTQRHYYTKKEANKVMILI